MILLITVLFLWSLVVLVWAYSDRIRTIEKSRALLRELNYRLSSKLTTWNQVEEWMKKELKKAKDPLRCYPAHSSWIGAIQKILAKKAQSEKCEEEKNVV